MAEKFLQSHEALPTAVPPIELPLTQLITSTWESITDRYRNIEEDLIVQLNLIDQHLSDGTPFTHLEQRVIIFEKNLLAFQLFCFVMTSVILSLPGFGFQQLQFLAEKYMNLQNENVHL